MPLYRCKGTNATNGKKCSRRFKAPRNCHQHSVEEGESPPIIEDRKETPLDESLGAVSDEDEYIHSINWANNHLPWVHRYLDYFNFDINDLSNKEQNVLRAEFITIADYAKKMSPRAGTIWSLSIPQNPEYAKFKAYFDNLGEKYTPHDQYFVLLMLEAADQMLQGNKNAWIEMPYLKDKNDLIRFAVCWITYCVSSRLKYNREEGLEMLRVLKRSALKTY